MAHAFELRPLLVAALVGGIALWTLGYVKRGTGSHKRDLANGAMLGVAVQVGVRVAGVS
jgi:hypothetical protein